MGVYAVACVVGVCCGRMLWACIVGVCCGRVLWACVVGVLWACVIIMYLLDSTRF